MELVLNIEAHYTYADYLTWADGQMRELIDGIVKMMATAASAKHQEINVNF